MPWKITAPPRVFAFPGGPLRPSLLLSLLLLVLLLPGMAHATTVAVLPLGQGVKGSAYEGLGEALAGMIVSDMAGAQGLTLVERQRLDALLSELELAKTGFIDPKTASQMGRGLGAELVLVGTFTVVDTSLALDARLVRVETGEVLEGATASGLISDFVSVEKDLVESLLGKLEARLDSKARRLFYTNVPTEDWGAFTAYSRGQAKAAAGELEAARKAYEEALARDPEFVNAAEGLARLQVLVADTRADDSRTRSNRYTRAEEAALSALPDVRTRKKDAAWTQAELADTALRFGLLLNRQRECDRYDEMIAYLDQVDWDPDTHDAPFPRWSNTLEDRAEALGITRWDSSVRHPNPVVYKHPDDREPRLWNSLTRFLFDGVEDGSARDGNHGVAWSLSVCHPESRRKKELAMWRKRLRETGMGEQREDEDGLTVFEQLTVVEAWSDAEDGRLSPGTQKALAALIAAHPDAATDAHEDALDAAENVASHADHQDRWRIGKLGLDEDTIRTRLEAMASGQAPFDKQSQAWCRAGWEQTFRGESERRLKNWNESVEDDSSTFLDVHWSAALVRTGMAMGCYKGVPAEVKNHEEALATLRPMLAQRHPTLYDPVRCDGNLDMLGGMLSRPPVAGGSGKWTFDAYRILFSLVQSRCIVETL